MAALSRSAARRLIDEIREENGGLSLDDRKATRPSVLKALANVRRKLGAATKTLATNLYSKDTRFVYELIQNAEDNEYSWAKAAGVDLYLSFSIYPDRIVLDSNEDGFREEHVRAICSTGESTKTTSQGYIGEKGIGFKSVFKVAKKVHIQSGPFSFSFQYTRDSDDDGLGMVTPFNEDYAKLPESVRTRITLVLLDASTFDQRLQDMANIPDTLLLFLGKLRVLHININPKTGSASETRYTHVLDAGQKMESVVKTVTVTGKFIETTVKRFYVQRKEIGNLPHDVARKHTDRATVVLAFPVDEYSVPVIEQQHVFAFLPLRLAGFTFLIQCDFVTQASREDVFHSARNKALLSGVAKTFRDAVLRFCDHPSLQYQWMRYLPDESVSDEFWKALGPEIISRLSKTCCLRSRSGTSLYLPAKLCWLAPNCYDQHGEPLFADLEEEIYLSSNYAISDYQYLKLLGTSKIQFKSIFARAKADLWSAESKFKAQTTEDDWHTRTSFLLSKPFGPKRYDTSTEALKALELIPLQGDSWIIRWVSANDLPIFLPNTGKVPVPTDLGLNLVHPAAVGNSARKKLFSHFGVKTAVASIVVPRIHRKYNALNPISLTETVSHLRYLYWNLSPEISSLDNFIWLLDQNEHIVHRVEGLQKPVYFEEGEEEYGPGQLLKPLVREYNTAPGLAVHYLNAAYLEALPSEVLHHNRSWKLWLEELAGVQTCPRLLNQSQFGLSDEFKYIAKYRSEKMVGLLQRHWAHYQAQMNDDIVQELCRIRVPVDGDVMRSLQETFFPLPELRSAVKRLHISHFPFLLMPKALDAKEAEVWRFLELFGVKGCGGIDNLDFYVEALNALSVDHQKECSQMSLNAVLQVYDAIERNCSSPDQAELVRTYFKVNKRIYIPPHKQKNATWINSEACVWSTPLWLEGKQCLKHISQFADREHLFRIVLRMEDANCEHYLTELRMLKEQDRGSIDRVTAIYRCLAREFENNKDWETLRISLEESQLVFAPLQRAWYPLSSCVWADNRTRIPQRVSISDSYSLLKDFFTEKLGVPKPNLAMQVQALKELAGAQPQRSELKNMIMLISSMNPTPDDVLDLRDSNIFLVRLKSGQKELVNTYCDFAIIDRVEFGDAFAGKIKILDFSMKEVRTCRPLLLALGLGNRHLSQSVKAESTVQGGIMVPQLTRSFRTKAYALFRCTVHYNSPRSRDGDRLLYDLLLRASIYVSDGISKSISVVQCNETVTVEKSRANFHLDDGGDEIRLYIPRNEDDREECFFRQLPRRLLAYFAISDPTAEAIVSGIIGCASLIAVDGILKDAGIIKVDGIERPDVPDFEIPQHVLDEIMLESMNTVPPSFGHSMQTPRLGSLDTDHEMGERYPDAPEWHPDFASHRISATVGLVSPSSILGYATPPRDQPSPENGYAALLERVIGSARSITVPAQGIFRRDALRHPRTVGGPALDPIFTTRSMERDRMVGAAGELFVFEVLLGLGLSSFGRDNWKSTVRKEVCVHDEYRDLEPWYGSETADIVYDDARGDLTKLLIANGYLDGGTWLDQRPVYYLEVKTTTRDCSEKFYMSGSQYRRMQRMCLQSGEVASEVYILFRVFDLEGETGMRVYVDPESSRLKGELDFKVDTWSVKPAGNLTSK